MHQVTANQNYNEVSPHTSHNDHHKKMYKIINAGEGVEEKKPFCTVCRSLNWYSHYGEQYGGSLKTKKYGFLWIYAQK